MVIPSSYRDRCGVVIADHIARTPGLLGAGISTTDGRLFVARSTTIDSQERLAAMSASLMALSESLLREVVFGRCSHVTLNGETGQLIAMRVPETRALFVLTTFASRDTSLGMQLSRSSACAAEIGTILAPVIPPPADRLAATPR